MKVCEPMKYLHTLFRNYLYFILDGNLTHWCCSHKREGLWTGSAGHPTPYAPFQVMLPRRRRLGIVSIITCPKGMYWGSFLGVFLCGILLDPAHLFCQLPSSRQILSCFVLFADNYSTARKAGRYKGSPKYRYIILLQFSTRLQRIKRWWVKWLSYFGYVMRAGSLEKSIVLGMISGKRRRGHPNTCWLDIIKIDTRMAMAGLKEAVWTVLMYRVAEGQTQQNGWRLW